MLAEDDGGMVEHYGHTRATTDFGITIFIERVEALLLVRWLRCNVHFFFFQLYHSTQDR